MKKYLLAAGLALATMTAAPAFAADGAPEHRFTRDGQTYVYTTTTKIDRVIISGRSLPSGTTFELTVRGDRITGFSGGQPVSFTMRDAQAKLTGTTLAAR